MMPWLSLSEATKRWLDMLEAARDEADKAPSGWDKWWRENDEHPDGTDYGAMIPHQDEWDGKP